MMKVSRFWGAAFIWGAILASSTAHAQYPYPANQSFYPAQPQQFYPTAYSQPQTGYTPMGSPGATNPNPNWQPPMAHFGNPNYWGQNRPATYPVSMQGTQSVITGGQGATSSPNDGPVPGQPNAPFAGELPYPSTGQPGFAPQSGYPGPAPGYQGGGVPYAGGMNGNAAPYAGGNGYWGGDQYSAGMGYGNGGMGYGNGGMGCGNGGMGYGNGGMGYGNGGMGCGNGGMGYGNGGMGCGNGGMGYGNGGMGYGNGGMGYGGDMSGYGCEMDCGPRAPLWYAGAYGLIFASDRRPHSTFSFDSANEQNQFTDSRDAQMDWNGGFAVTVGRYFGCGQSAVELCYWGWFPDDVAVFTYGTSMVGNLNGIFNWNSLDYNGATADTWVDNAQVHALFRSTEAQNIEVNVLHFGTGGCGGSRGQFSLLGGFRYFRFRDDLMFASDTTDAVIDGDASEIYYRIQTENELFGVQVGGLGSFCLTPRFVLNGGTKFGLYENVITHNSAIYGPSGTAVINNGPFAGATWNVGGQKEDVSFLGELFLGGSYCIGSRWSVSAGYRVVAITGMAMPTSQIYPDLRGINDVATIESSDSVVLHGWYIGGQFCF